MRTLFYKIWFLFAAFQVRRMNRDVEHMRRNLWGNER